MTSPKPSPSDLAKKLDLLSDPGTAIVNMTIPGAEWRLLAAALRLAEALQMPSQIRVDQFEGVYFGDELKEATRSYRAARDAAK